MSKVADALEILLEVSDIRDPGKREVVEDAIKDARKGEAPKPADDDTNSDPAKSATAPKTAKDK